ncbi:phage terminase small subunit P27 family [Sutterella wadsworthensis]|nr:phage terminase small subunit P27 family [Sutterella wadsworthensis]
MTKEAREAWRIAVENAPKGLLAVTDFTVLERWARNYALYRKLAKAVDHDGTTIVTEKTDGTVRRELNPDAKLLIQIQTVLLACERELGFTPSSRARVNIATKDEPVNEFDGF